jgi:hypothetical protein
MSAPATATEFATPDGPAASACTLETCRGGHIVHDGLSDVSHVLLLAPVLRAAMARTPMAAAAA